MTAKDIREQIQYQLNQKDQKAQNYIDTVHNIEQIVIKAQGQVKNINYDAVLAVGCPKCGCNKITGDGTKSWCLNSECDFIEAT